LTALKTLFNPSMKALVNPCRQCARIPSRSHELKFRALAIADHGARTPW
jgi:hypothetical protein